MSNIPKLDTADIAQSIVSDAMSLASVRVVASAELEEFITKAVREKVGAPLLCCCLLLTTVTASTRICPSG